MGRRDWRAPESLGLAQEEAATTQLQPLSSNRLLSGRNSNSVLSDDLVLKEARNTDLCVNLLPFKNCLLALPIN